MPSFEELFLQSKGKPITYNGKVLYLADHFPTTDVAGFRLTFESTNGDWRQGVALDVDVSFMVRARTIPKSIVLWEDTAPTVVDFKISQGPQHMIVWNVWDSGNGVTDAWHNGAAMIVEEIPNGRR